MLRFLPLLIAVSLANGETIRVVAANLTSGNQQTYSPDNGNHSNPEGAGARILKGLKPDIVLIQEFNTTMPARQWINQTLGEKYFFAREVEEAVPNFIPNGVISRFPIVESGEWDDPTQMNRDFLWAKIRLPNGKFLWAISVHLYSQKPGIREKEAQALIEKLKTLPPEDLVVLGGDFNTKSRDEPCVGILETFFRDAEHEPADQQGDEDTNANRNKPYDWVLADAELEAWGTPVRIAGAEFPGGLVFDSRTYTPLTDVAPIQASDSAVPNMQHMAVVRDFLVPDERLKIDIAPHAASSPHP